jgi:hypothetical protein
MWSALFGSQETGTLVLKAHPNASHVSGFKNGGELRVAADVSGQTVGALLSKFNKYRGPDQQIHRVWDLQGKEVSGSTPVTGLFVVVVKAESIQ